jgi:hypothetical protein
MTNKAVGWTLAAASLGMMLVLISADIKNLQSFHDAMTPLFVGNMLAHIGNVLMAFVGGKLIPTEPQNQRLEDKP